MCSARTGSACRGNYWRWVPFPPSSIRRRRGGATTLTANAATRGGGHAGATTSRRTAIAKGGIHRGQTRPWRRRTTTPHRWGWRGNLSTCSARMGSACRGNYWRWVPFPPSLIHCHWGGMTTLTANAATWGGGHAGAATSRMTAITEGGIHWGRTRPWRRRTMTTATAPLRARPI